MPGGFPKNSGREPSVLTSTPELACCHTCFFCLASPTLTYLLTL